MFVNAVIMGLANDLSWCLSWKMWLLDDTDEGFMAGTEGVVRYLVLNLNLSDVSKVRYHLV